MIGIENMKNMTYKDFVDFLFDRPANITCLKLFFQDDFIAPEFDNKVIIEHISRVFHDIENLSGLYSEEQLVNGLEYLIDSACGLVCYSFLSSEVAHSSRITAIASMYDVFEKVFDKKCTNTDAPLDRTASSYNYLCEMWWDVFPRHGFPRNPDMESIDRTILNTITTIFLLENEACKKSALHGLGHWHSEYPEEVEAFITSQKHKIPESLKVYSERAMAGDVE